MANIAAQRIRREFKEVIKSEEVRMALFTHTFFLVIVYIVVITLLNNTNTKKKQGETYHFLRTFLICSLDKCQSSKQNIDYKLLGAP